MSIMPSQLTSINERTTRTFKSTSPSYSRINKERSIRRIYPSGQIQKFQQSPMKKIFNDNEINLQISKQMRQIQALLQQIRPQLQQIQRKNNERSMREILFELQEKIKHKNYLLTQINNQNKQLKSANKKALRYSTQNPQDFAQKQEKTFKLAQQLKEERQELIKTKNQHIEKKHKLQQIRHQVMKVEGEYLDRCKKTKEKPLTYEMFKCLNQEKKKQLNNQLKNQQRKRTKRQTLKQMLKSNSFHSIPHKTEKNLKEIVNRKKIAEQALKTARKKYNQEISQFYAKLQFLREQDLALVQTLREKEVEFYTLEMKFNESKKLNGGGSNKNSHNQKLQNTLRFKGDYQDMEEMRKTRKSPLKFSTHQVV